MNGIELRPGRAARLDHREGTRLILAGLLPWAHIDYHARHRFTCIAVTAAAGRH